jgi:hypothetical protein
VLSGVTFSFILLDDREISVGILLVDFAVAIVNSLSWFILVPAICHIFQEIFVIA